MKKNEIKPSAPVSAGGTDRDLAWTQLAQIWVLKILQSLNIINLKSYNVL